MRRRHIRTLVECRRKREAEFRAEIAHLDDCELREWAEELTSDLSNKKFPRSQRRDYELELAVIRSLLGA